MRFFVAQDCAYLQIEAFGAYELVLNLRGRFARVDGPKWVSDRPYRRHRLWGGK